MSPIRSGTIAGKRRLPCDMMKHMLLALMLTLLPLPAVAADFGGAVWRAKILNVYDYSPAAWDGVFERTVADANAILPKRAPNVVYHRMPVRDCADVPIKRGAVIICLGSPERWPPDFRQYQAMSYYPDVNRAAKWARVELNAQNPVRQSAMPALACHELIGHAILGIEDDYNSKTPAESCIHAWSEKPGTWDVAVANWLYQKFGETRKSRR